MHVDELTIEVRNLNLDRIGQIDPRLWSDVKLGPKHLGVGQWSLSLPAEDPMAVALATPGAGIIATGPDGVILSGPVAPFSRTQTPADTSGMVKFDGFSDDVILWDALAFPDPAHASTAQTLAYDVQTSAAETLLHHLVTANLGSGTGTGQRGGLASKLTSYSADLARGGTKTLRARFDNLGETLVEFAKLGGLGFHLVQVGDHLEFQTYAPVDRSALVRLDVNNGTLARIEYSTKPPKVTRVLVAGQGEGADRTIIERTSTDSLAAETAWGRRIMQFKDQRNTDDAGELEQAGDKILTDGGSTQVATKVIPADALNIAYGVDWREGDQVAVVVGDTETKVTVSSAVIAIGSSGVLVGARIGEE